MAQTQTDEVSQGSAGRYLTRTRSSTPKGSTHPSSKPWIYPVVTRPAHTPTATHHLHLPPPSSRHSPFAATPQQHPSFLSPPWPRHPFFLAPCHS